MEQERHSRKPYPTDVSDEEWAFVTPYLALVREDRTLAERIVPDLPYTMAEVVYACRCEMAATLDDVLERRTHVAMEDREHGMGAAERVAACMARELGWDDAEVARQIADYERRTALLAVPDLRAPLAIS